MKYLKTYEFIENYNIRQFVHNLKKYVVYNDNKDNYKVQIISEPDKGREYYTKYENVLRKVTKTEIELYYTTKKYNL